MEKKLDVTNQKFSIENTRFWVFSTFRHFVPILSHRAVFKMSPGKNVFANKLSFLFAKNMIVRASKTGVRRCVSLLTGILWKKARRQKSKVIDRKYVILTFFEFLLFWPHFVASVCIQNVIGQKMFSQIKFRFYFQKYNRSSF